MAGDGGRDGGHEARGSRRRLIVCALLIIGGLMRFYGLGAKSLWVDEINAANQSRSIANLKRYSLEGHEPPLRLYVVWALQRAADKAWARLPASRQSPPNWGVYYRLEQAAIRLPAAMFGALSILLILWVGQAVWDWRTGVAAAILLAVSPWHLYHSQDARYYGALIFLGLAAVGLTARVLQDPGPLWRWVLLAACCALNLYVTYLAVFSILPIILILLFFTGKAWMFRDEDGARSKQFVRGLLLAALVGFICMLPWTPVLLEVVQRYTGRGGAAAAAQPPKILIWKTTYNWAYANEYLQFLGTSQPILKWALVAMVAAGLLRCLFVPFGVPPLGGSVERAGNQAEADDTGPKSDSVESPGRPITRDRRWVLALALFWFVLPWAIILATGMRHFFPPRYMIHYLPLYLLLAGAGAVFLWDAAMKIASRLSEEPRRTALMLLRAAAALAMLAALIGFARADWRYFRTEKQAWREVARFLNRAAPPGSAVLTGGSWTHLGLEYYGREIDHPLNLFPRRFYAVEIMNEMPHYRHVWYVTWGPVMADTQVLLQQWFELVKEFPGLEGSIRVYRSKAN
jgi:hypothetical protein